MDLEPVRSYDLADLDAVLRRLEVGQWYEFAALYKAYVAEAEEQDHVVAAQRVIGAELQRRAYPFRRVGTKRAYQITELPPPATRRKRKP